MNISGHRIIKDRGRTKKSLVPTVAPANVFDAARQAERKIPTVYEMSTDGDYDLVRDKLSYFIRQQIKAARQEARVNEILFAFSYLPGSEFLVLRLV